MPAPAAALILALAALTQVESPFQLLRAQDRAVQRAAVESLTHECDGCTPHLLGIWRSTERFDVRAHIAEVLMRLGPEGMPALIELTRDLNVVNDDGQRNLIIRALAPSGPAALDALIAEIEASPDKHSVVFLLPLAKELDIDPVPAARRLLASSNPLVRVNAVRHVGPVLPIVERSRTFLALAHDPDERVRYAATNHPGLPAWPDADRAAFPADFDAYITGLADLLASPDDNVVRGAAGTLRHCGRPASAAPALRTIMADPARALWTRSDAMRAYLALTPDRAAAITEVVSLTATFPIEASAALADIPPHEIPDAVIPTLVAALKPARGREETWAADVLVRIGPRAVPPLIGALSGPDADLSAFAAEALGRIGPPAAAAVDPLIAQLTSRGTGWQGEMYARALLAIAPESTRAQDALAAVITHPSDDPMHTYVAGNALRELMREHGDAPWVRALADPVLRYPKHPLHEWIVVSDPPESEEPALTADPSVLLDQLLFGEGNAPFGAMTALGRTRPITPDILDLIRAHLDDPRGAIRSAAVHAAGNAGEAASPLLDELLERGQAALASGRGYDFAEALQRIAPHDPRVIAFIAADRETRRQPRRVFPHESLITDH